MRRNVFKVGEMVHCDDLTKLPVGSVVKDPEGRFRVTADPAENDHYMFTDRQGWDDVMGEWFEVVVLAPSDKHMAEVEWVAQQLWNRRNSVVGLFGNAGSKWEDTALEHRYVYTDLAEWVLSNYTRKL